MFCIGLFQLNINITGIKPDEELVAKIILAIYLINLTLIMKVKNW